MRKMRKMMTMMAVLVLWPSMTWAETLEAKEAKPLKIRRVAVESTNLAAVGYSRKAKILEIQFVYGPVYRFHDVPRAVHKGLMKAESKGRYFHEQIQGKYRSEKLEK